MWSKKDCPMKEMKNFMATHKIRLTNLDKKGDVLSEDRLVKFGLVEEHSLSNEHVRSMMGAFTFPFELFFLCLLCFVFLSC